VLGRRQRIVHVGPRRVRKLAEHAVVERIEDGLPGAAAPLAGDAELELGVVGHHFLPQARNTAPFDSIFKRIRRPDAMQCEAGGDA
jgi:hypothetical protein